MDAERESLPSATAIERASAVGAAERVAAALRARIVEGELAPGAPLREVALAGVFDVSRNTLREALRILAADGLVRYEANRGATVTRLDADDVADIFRTRRVLEVGGIEAARTVEDPDFDGLRSDAEAFLRGLDERDRQAILDADLGFHRRLVAYLGSPRLGEHYRQVMCEMRLALSIVYEGMRASGEQHLEIHRLLRTGRFDEAKRVLLDHLASAERDVQQLNRFQGPIV